MPLGHFGSSVETSLSAFPRRVQVCPRPRPHPCLDYLAGLEGLSKSGENSLVYIIGFENTNYKKKIYIYILLFFIIKYK